MAWGKAGSDTLTGTGDLMTITDLPANLSNFFISHTLASGQTEPLITFNNDTGSNYAYRYSSDGGSDSTQTSGSNVFTHTASNTTDNSWLMYCINISAEEKLFLMWSMGANTAGAGNAPTRREYAGKWVNTSAQITEIDATNGGTGDFLTGSNITALGSDLTPASAIPFPENVELGSRAEITDTRKIYYRMNSDYVTDKWFELGTLPYAGGRGVFAGGYNGSGLDSMDYITIATTGTVTDFGNLTSSRYGIGSVANTLRGVFAGGQSSSTVMDFITPATTGNATTFGTLNRTQSYGMMGGASETTGVFAGGESSMTTEITKITIDTGAVQNANYGNLTTARKQGANFSDGTKAFFAGGEEGGQG